jgi:large subunit ribosomal protein L25
MASIAVKRRTSIGKNACKKLRKTGMIPAIIYGHKKEVYAIEINKEEFKALLDKNEKVFNLILEDDVHENVIIKEISYDTFGENMLHIDFYRIDLNAKVEIAVPIHYIGIPIGTQNGGVWEKNLLQLEVTCLPIHIPEKISVNVEKLDIRMNIRVHDLKIAPELEITNDPEAIITIVHAPKVDEEEEISEDSATEPERITKSREEMEKDH